MYKVSVIIACVNGIPFIGECLTALKEQSCSAEYEVIVSSCCSDGTSEYIRTHFPAVQLLEFEERLSIPELRTIGMSKATGDFIAITEDHCIADENWIDSIINAHHSGYDVVGGAVINGSKDRTVDWAVYFCEYSYSMPPIPSGEVENIAGNNASYRRDVLNRVNESVRRNFWEFFIHEELRNKGVRFLSVPSMVVHHKKDFTFFYFLVQRYYYSRSFAGMRMERTAGMMRMLYIVMSLFLPFIMMWRITGQVFRKKQHYREYILSVPYLMVFVISYALGEFIGYTAGPGDSLLKVD